MNGSGPRTQAERDAATVEMGFAVVTGIALAGSAYLIVVAPAVLAGVPEPWPWLLAGKWIAGGVFVARVTQVLVRWRRSPGTEPEEAGSAQQAGPDQPGLVDEHHQVGTVPRPARPEPDRRSADIGLGRER